MTQFPAVLALADLDGVNGFVLAGTVAGERAGISVASAGDVNGDGFDDLLIGAYGANSYAGAAYVVFGGSGGLPARFELSSLDGSNGFRLGGIDPDDEAGISVSGAGDVNGDGFGDIIVGASGGDPGGRANAGESYIVFGKAGGFAANIALSGLDGTNGLRIDGIAIADRSGRFVSAAGDVNGDGLGDVVIGAFGADPAGRSLAGEVYVVFGRSGPQPATLALSSLNGSNGFRLPGLAPGDQTGVSAMDAGDVNGDGIGDIIIGAWRADPGGRTDAGTSYVVFGRRGGFASSLDLGALNGSNGFQIRGIDTDDYSGRSVSGAGDVNGDGFDDVIVGSVGGDRTGHVNAGESYVIFGKASGFGSAFELSSIDGVNGFRIEGVDAGDDSGRSVAGAGDVNGDGFDDVIVGAHRADPNGVDRAGETYVIFGKASGLGTSISLSSLDGTNGFRLDGIHALDYSGRLATRAGDVNGDGFGDLLIGANRADPDGRDLAGESYVVFGVKPVEAVTRVGSAAAQTISGGFGDDVLSGLGGADILYGHEGNDQLNGGSGDDVMVGGAGDDLYIVSSPGDVVLELANEGRDTVQTSISMTLAPTLENLVMFGVAAIDATGNRFGNTMTGNSASNTLIGLDGADRLDGKGGADTMIGGKGNEIYYVDDPGDRVIELANEGIDLVRSTLAIDLTTMPNVENATVTSAADVAITGSDGDNVLTGGNGANLIDGGAGNDTIRGNFGADTLIGGSGADTFVWIGINESRLSAPDLVADFESGIDRLDLRGIDARASVAGNQDFVLDTDGDFAEGEIRLVDHGTFLMLEANTDRDPAVELAIRFDGITSLSAADFL